MKKFFFFLPLLLFAACISDPGPDNQVKIPTDSIIPEHQMILLLADAHIIEAALVIARNRGSNTHELGNFYYAGLFSKYKISRNRYQQNLEYYREDPDAFIRLYEKVNRELIEREKKFVKSVSD